MGTIFLVTIAYSSDGCMEEGRKGTCVHFVRQIQQILKSSFITSFVANNYLLLCVKVLLLVKV